MRTQMPLVLRLSNNEPVWYEGFVDGFSGVVRLSAADSRGMRWKVRLRHDAEGTTDQEVSRRQIAQIFL